jgi:acyl-[acyl-carrier-protein]-phospholipid O-acyltransferase/long-chain-fatty-acid--[acyl-carrier-protein] ligase
VARVRRRFPGGLTLAAASSSASLGDGSPGFRPLLVVRVLTVLNDNLLRWLVIGLGKRAAGASGTALVLTAGTAGYVLPFIALAWLAGWLGDRFAKRSVVVANKFAEIGIVLVATAVVAWGVSSGPSLGGLPTGLWLLLGAVTLIGLQTALMAPSLLGTIPEILPAAALSRGNGIIAMLSLAATLVGMAGGNWLADMTPLVGQATATGPFGGAVPAALVLGAVAVAGWLASLRLPRVPAADPHAPPPWNVLARTFGDLADLVRAPRLAAAAAGIVFFWALAAVAQLNVDQFASESGAASQGQVVPFLVALVGGIGLGSLLAGRFSRRGIDPGSKVDLGLVPLGGTIMTVACLALALQPTALVGEASVGWGRFAGAIAWLAVLGTGAGLFDVPLEAYLQEQSPPARRGAVLASTNFLTFAGMFVASLVYGALRMPVDTDAAVAAAEAGATAAAGAEAVRPWLSARSIFGLFAIASLLATAAGVYAAPRATLRLFVGAIVGTVWRYRVRDEGLLPERGPAVIVANHLSWLDGFLLPLSAPRPVRMVVYGPNIKGRFLNMLAEQWRFILFDPKPKSIGRALKTIQGGLADGDCVGIFCEGGISRNGQVLGFKRGLEWLLSRVEAPIVPASIDGLWGSQLTFSEGRYFTKWIRRQRRGGPWRPRRVVTLTFGRPLPVGTPPDEARLALQELTAEAVRRRMAGIEIPGLPAGIDAAAAAATAEAFDGCCLLRRSDRLLASLAAGDPLHDTLGSHGAALLGIHAAVVPADASPEDILATLARERATLWLAQPVQVAAVAAALAARGAAADGPGAGAPAGLGSHLAAVVMPLGTLGELAAARSAAERFQAVTAVEAVTAYAPAEAGGLVAMNTPLSRRGGDHETTCDPTSLGRVVNGVVVWPATELRERLGFQPLEGGVPHVDGCVVVGATLPCPAGRDAVAPRSALLSQPFTIDSEGFLRGV